MVSSKIIFAFGFLLVIASVSAFPTVTKSEDDAVTTVRSSVNEEIVQDGSATTEVLSDDVTTVSPAVAANDEVDVVVLDNVENIVVVPVEKKTEAAVSNVAGEKLEVVPAQKTVTTVSENVEKVVVEPVATKSEVVASSVAPEVSSVVPEVSSVAPEVSSVAPEKKTEAVESKTPIVVSSRSKRSPQHSWLNIFRRGHPQSRRGHQSLNPNHRISYDTYESIHNNNNNNNMYYGHQIENQNGYGSYGGNTGYED